MAPPRVLRGKPKYFVVQEILDKKGYGKNIKYLVHWRGFNKPEDYTWEPRGQLIKDVPEMVAEFDKKHRRKK